MIRMIRFAAAVTLALILAACGGGGGGGRDTMPRTMPDVGGGGDGNGDANGWEVVRASGMPVGYEHTGYGLVARFDATGANPTITASSPTRQPELAGTWSGRWSARYTALTSDYGELDRTDDGNARINVTVAGSNVQAMLTYAGVNIPGIPSTVSSNRVSVTDGRFEPSIRLSTPEGPSTFRGVGQFGGTDQKGVVGYVSGSDFRSVFYGVSDTMPTTMPDVGSGGNGNGNGNGMDPSDFGAWEIVRASGTPVGYEHTGYGLVARFDATGANPTITASSPTRQPELAGTWSGRWSARYTALTSDYGELDRTDDGNARINVTVAGSNVQAMLTYAGVNIPGIPSTVSSNRVSVTDGRFEPSIRLSTPEGPSTFRGVGQFGGTDQKGVVGYVSGPDFRSVFYGSR